MSQLSLYIQTDILNKIEYAAKKENLSISMWAKEKLENSLKSEWSEDFLNLFGSIQDSSFQKSKALHFKSDSKREKF